MGWPCMKLLQVPGDWRRQRSTYRSTLVRVEPERSASFYIFENSDPCGPFETHHFVVQVLLHFGFRVAFQKILMETIRSFRPGPALSGIRAEDSPESSILPENHSVRAQR